MVLARFDLRPIYAHRSPMDRPSGHTSNNLVSRILQVALGLFVTTSDLPPLPQNHEFLSYDCSFDTDCRWSSVGGNVDRWRIARGEPDSLLWLAATGTMQLPREPFVLIESRGNPVDSLMTDAIRCQKGYADLSFTYWAIGNADLEICLTDIDGHKFNCTGQLNSHVMPGKVSLKIPELQKPFRVMISPSRDAGVIVLDDIRYDASICHSPPGGSGSGRGRPDFMSTSAPKKIQPWTVRKTSVEVTEPTTEKSTTTSTTTTTTTNEAPTTEAPSTTTEEVSPLGGTEAPFDLLILGNKTKPLFDRRTGEVISDATKLLCDFNNEFACQWGPEAGRWAVVEKGAIPSLEDSIADPTLLPTYPAALVLQGTAMLTSDPIKCQTGTAKVLFRYWSNGDILLQVCALGHGNNSDIIHCAEQTRTVRHERNTLAIFEMNKQIAEEFTLNILLTRLPISENAKESPKDRPTTTTQPPLILGGRRSTILSKSTSTTPEVTTTTELITEPTTESTTTRESTTSRTTTEASTEAPTTETIEEEIVGTTPEESTIPGIEETTENGEEEVATEEIPEEVTPEELIEEEETTTPRTTTVEFITTPDKYTKIPYTKKKPFMPRILTTFAPVYPEELYTQRPKTNKQTKSTWTTNPPESRQDDYCELLNCNFDDTACNYLNHGLTKKPWTLRNRGYGYPLTGATDIRATQTNGQFVSSILDPGDIAILESPKFNATKSLNVLLFQYFRPSQMTTIRLCLGSRYTNPMRTVSSFTQCPSILRSVTSKNAYRWNTVHVQLPPGTTHFYLVAHNSERAEQRAAMAIDNMRVAICDTRGFAPDYIDETTDFGNFMQLQ
ncbi:unnamed protein product [Caenorhabditis angaria]|uniref:MAM domain-containing protein n=1 Tax=Caenorhabditis angaria TaxID=860376 RepID=A0A9P1J3U1_9PELO|nr:unnamed protein product [Caenorhabditis angaria]